MIELFRKLEEKFPSESMYKLGVGLVIFDLAMALIWYFVGIPAVSYLFLASGLCALAGAVGNWYVVKLRNDSGNKEGS